MIPSVTCERCHGPGRAHVEAARRGAGRKTSRCPWGWKAGRSRASSSSAAVVIGIPAGYRRSGSTQTIPPWPDSSRSACRNLAASRGVHGRLSCVSCHDPHARSSSDPAIYERVCLSCHQMPSKGTTGGNRARDARIRPRPRSARSLPRPGASPATCRESIPANMSCSRTTGSGFAVLPQGCDRRGSAVTGSAARPVSSPILLRRSFASSDQFKRVFEPGSSRGRGQAQEQQGEVLVREAGLEVARKGRSQEPSRPLGSQSPQEE